GGEGFDLRPPGPGRGGVTGPAPASSVTRHKPRLLLPIRRQFEQRGNTIALRHGAINGRLHYGWAQKREAERHADRAIAAALSLRNLFRIGDSALDQLFQPQPRLGDSLDETGARF